MFELFAKGCLIGFSIAMPVGPIGLLCIRQSLISGALAGVLVGLGAASADAFYGALAGFGVTAVAQIFAAHSKHIEWVGAIFLCYLGITTFFSKTERASDHLHKGSRCRLYLTAFCLTLTNPMTILSFAAIYAGLGIGRENSGMPPAIVMTAGVFVGSVIWWLVLSCTSALFKKHMGQKAALWLNRISGAAILGFGVLFV